MFNTVHDLLSSLYEGNLRNISGNVCNGPRKSSVNLGNIPDSGMFFDIPKIKAGRLDHQEPYYATRYNSMLGVSLNMTCLFISSATFIKRRQVLSLQMP